MFSGGGKLWETRLTLSGDATIASMSIKVTCCDGAQCWRAYSLEDFRALVLVRVDDTGDEWRVCSRCGKPVVCRVRTLADLGIDLRDPIEVMRARMAPVVRARRIRFALFAAASVAIAALVLWLWVLPLR